MQKFILSSLLFLASTIARAELIITFGGDVNLNQSRGEITATGTRKWQQRATWASLFAGISPYLNGHVNFANLETVVSDRLDLPDGGGKYVFRAHPKGVEYATKIGFNLFSLANNHAGDYGQEGIRETLTHLEDLTGRTPLRVSGLGWSREEALRPALISVQTDQGTYTIAMLAMSGTMPYDYRATGQRPGTLAFYSKEDFTDAMRSLREAKADYRILSVHWGVEGTVRFEPAQRPWALKALRDGNVDLFLGHHPHRVHPVERVGDKLIFYSLGNYLMVGGASLDAQPNDRNYGLLGRLYLNFDASKRRLIPQAVEALPLTEMHFKSHPLEGKAAQLRINALNANGTAQLGDKVLAFKLGEQGGFACLGEAQGPLAEKICNGKAVETPAAPTQPVEVPEVVPETEPEISPDAPATPKVPKAPVNKTKKLKIPKHWSPGLY